MTTITIPQQIAHMDIGRLNSYKTHLDFYNGGQWKEGKVRKDAPWVRRLTFNYARVFIDKVTSYLMSDLNFAVDPLEETATIRDLAGRAEDALYRVYDRNNLPQLDFDTEIDTAVLGDGCYKVTWDSQMKDVRVSAPDVQGIYAWWVGDDLTRIWRVASRYVLTADDVQMLYAQRPKSQTCTVVEVWTDKTFELWIDDQRTRATRNPYGFIPFVIYANIRKPKEFWGLSDLPDLIEPARELNRALSQLSMILELSGNPIAVLENVDKAEDIAVQPGAVWEIPEKAKAYLLDLLEGGGVKLHADYIDLLYRTLHDISEAPRTSFGDNQRALSGVALEMELHPLLQKIKRKRLSRSVAYQRRNEMILRILASHGALPWRGSAEESNGRGSAEGFNERGTSLDKIRTRIIWGSVLPQDHGRLVEEETRLVSSGIHSRRTAADNLGIKNPESEFARWLEEERALGTNNDERRSQS